jgi:hypothetical protein
MVRLALTIITAASLLAAAALSAAAQDFKPDEDGFIRNWLVLAPIPLAAGQSGAEGLGKQQVKDEAKLKPKEGDKVTVGNKDLVWKRYQASEYFVDFNGFLGQETEDSVAYAVCYLTADAELKDLTMKTGSDDQAKLYLNGKEVLKKDEPRPLTRDEDSTGSITLNRGVNVLVFKVVNEKMDWSCCVRFLDKGGNAVRNLKVGLAP